ncbi:MAG: DEAD/DEAH box helicase, partial [Flammeovirgaceae bacterium]
INNIQIIVIAHTRELANQIYSVYLKATKFATDYKIANLLDKSNPKDNQIVIGTLGQIKNIMQGRTKCDLSSLRAVIIDEADYFFEDQKNEDTIVEINKVLKETLKLK